MATVDITFKLPADLARQAKSHGLLDPPLMQLMIERALRDRERARAALEEHFQRLEQDDAEPMNMDEINAIVHEVRVEQRARREDHR